MNWLDIPHSLPLPKLAKLSKKPLNMKILITLISSFLLITVSNFVDAQTTGNTVDLLWEGETYTPTFYAGRSLPSAGSLVRAVAMPNVIQNRQRLSSSQLVFKW